MSRIDLSDLSPAVRRPGPYETAYDVRRGYELPPPAPRSAAPVPVMVAARRDDSGGAPRG